VGCLEALGVRFVDRTARPQGRNPRDTARDLSGLAGELAALKADARHWLTSPEYAVLHLRLENAHAAVEAALVEARRRVRMNSHVRGPFAYSVRLRRTASVVA
jgi:hypothetical protein